MSSPASMRLVGADVLLDGALRREALALSEGRIGGGDGPTVDLSGYWLLPGIVDVRMGVFARHMAPAVGQVFPVPHALATAERVAASYGVTTAWIPQRWSWEGGGASPDVALEVMRAWQAFAPGALIDLRLQLRVETHMPETRDALLAAIEGFAVDYVMFTNRLPDALHMSQRATHRLAAWAEREGLAVEDYIARLKRAKDRAPEVPRYLLSLAEAFDRAEVRYGSHDDPDGETRERMHQLGADIAEFPLKAGAAAVARANGNPIVLNASDVLRGGTRPGAVPTMALLAKGMGDVLASGDHPSALVPAAFQLVKGDVSFARAWSMLSETPARMMGLFDRGALVDGRRADVAVLNPATKQVEATIAAGRLAFATGMAAERFFGARAGVVLAAE